MRRGGMPWVKAWTKATRFLGSMRSHRSPTIRGHRRAGPSPTRPPAAAQIRVICARSAVREAYPQEASKFAKVVKTTRDGRQLTRRYFALGDTDPSEGPTTGGAACSGAHPQGCPPDCAGPPLGLLLFQGRAAGVHVIGCVQDPRKETLPFRSLFPTRVALRLVERTETDMVLSASAALDASRSTLGLSGVGYVLLDGSPDLVRVRTGYLTDADITTMAAEYATPHREDGWVAGVLEPRTAEVLDTEWEAFAADYRTRHGVSDDD